MGAHGWGGSSPPTLLCARVPKATSEPSKGRAKCFIASGQVGRAQDVWLGRDNARNVLEWGMTRNDAWDVWLGKDRAGTSAQ